MHTTTIQFLPFLRRFIKAPLLAFSFAVIALAGAGAHAADGQSATIEGATPRAYFQQMMSDYFLAPTQTPAQAVDKYLAKDAVHQADGKEVSRQDFIGHITYLQKNIKVMTFDIQQVVFDGEWLSERHLGHTELKDGRAIDSEVMILFHLSHGKIDRAFEMTRPISGVDSDRAIHTAK